MSLILHFKMERTGIKEFFTTYDTLSMLSSELNLKDVTSMIEACRINPDVNEDDLNEIERKRVNPVTLFSQLTDNPEKLVDEMILNNVLLSGSRAVHYIYPFFDCKDSDWDFYCQNGKSGEFIKHLESIGAEEDYVRNDPIPYPNFNDIHVYYYKLSRNSVTHTIQVIIPRDRAMTAFHLITNFHTTIVQCFITGYAAVSMYHGLSSQRRMIDWKSNNENPSRTRAMEIDENCDMHRLRRYIQKYRLEHYSPKKSNDIFLNRMQELRYDYASRPDATESTVRDMLSREVTVQVLEGINSKMSYGMTITNDMVADAIIKQCTCVDPTTKAILKYQQRGFTLLSDEDLKSFNTTGEKIVLRSLTNSDTTMVQSLCGFITNPVTKSLAEKRLRRLYSAQWFEHIGTNSRAITAADNHGGKFNLCGYAGVKYIDVSLGGI